MSSFHWVESQEVRFEKFAHAWVQGSQRTHLRKSENPRDNGAVESIKDETNEDDRVKEVKLEGAFVLVPRRVVRGIGAASQESRRRQLAQHDDGLNRVWGVGEQEGLRFLLPRLRSLSTGRDNETWQAPPPTHSASSDRHSQAVPVLHACFDR